MKENEIIQKEIEKVDEIISSNKELILKYPEDKTLLLSLQSFEGRKKDLLFDIELKKDRTLEEELKLIQKTIADNKKLQKEAPHYKEDLEKMLKGLKKYENQLLNELNPHNNPSDLNIKVESQKL